MKNSNSIIKAIFFLLVLSFFENSAYAQAGFTVKATEAGGLPMDTICFANSIQYTIDLDLYTNYYRPSINPTNPVGCAGMKMLAYIDDMNSGYILAWGDIPLLSYSAYKDCPSGERVYKYSGTFSFYVDLNQYMIDPTCLDGSGVQHDVILELVERDVQGNYYPYDFSQCYNTCYNATYNPYVITKFFCCDDPQSMVVNDQGSTFGNISNSTAFYNGEEVQFLVDSELDMESEVQIFNLNGQNIFNTEVFLNKGKNQFSVSGLNIPNNGISFARILLNGKFETLKFYKNY